MAREHCRQRAKLRDLRDAYGKLLSRSADFLAQMTKNRFEVRPKIDGADVFFFFSQSPFLISFFGSSFIYFFYDAFQTGQNRCNANCSPTRCDRYRKRPFLSSPLIFHRLPLSRRHYLDPPPLSWHERCAHFICHLLFVVVIYFFSSYPIHFIHHGIRVSL